MILYNVLIVLAYVIVTALTAAGNVALSKRRIESTQKYTGMNYSTGESNYTNGLTYKMKAPDALGVSFIPLGGQAYLGYQLFDYLSDKEVYDIRFEHGKLYRRERVEKARQLFESAKEDRIKKLELAAEQAQKELDLVRGS